MSKSKLKPFSKNDAWRIFGAFLIGLSFWQDKALTVTWADQQYGFSGVLIVAGLILMFPRVFQRRTNDTGAG